MDGEAYIDFLMSSLKDTFDFDGKILNGYFVCYVILQLLLIHVPLLIALIAADMISGEANMGTLRLLLTKPVSKTAFMLAKFFAASIYTFVLLLWIAILALAVSIFLFGTDDLLIQKTLYVVQISQNDVFWRYIGAFCFAFLSMLTVTAVGFLLINLCRKFDRSHCSNHEHYYCIYYFKYDDNSCVSENTTLSFYNTYGKLERIF